MRYFHFIILIFLLLQLLFSGCNNDSICLSNQHALRAYFMSMEDKTRVQVLNTTIFGLGMENDSIYKEEDVANMFLPMAFSGDTTTFVIMVQTLADTIHFVNTKKMNFISRECGFTLDFVIDTVYFSNRFIDSVAIINPNIRYNENVDNVEIYISF